MKTSLTLFTTLLLLLFSSSQLLAQYDDDEELMLQPKPATTNSSSSDIKKNKKFDPNKLSLGGYFGASFGDVVYVDLSPIAAYYVIDRMQVGVGFIYQYINYKDYYGDPFDKTSIYGGRIFDRVFVWDNLFIQLEYLVQNGEIVFVDDFGNYFEQRQTFHNGFLGGGYNVPVGGNSYMSLLISVNLNENELYPTRQAYFSIGFGIGL